MKILDIAELVVVARVLADQGRLRESIVRDQVAQMEDAADYLTNLVANALGADTSGSSMREPEFAGFSVGIYPKQAGDPVPEELEPYDTEGDWQPLDNDRELSEPIDASE